MSKDREYLRDALEDLILAIDDQIAEVEKVADEMGIPARLLRHADGSFMLGGLLIGKVNALRALVDLQ